MDKGRYTVEDYTMEESRLYFGMWKSTWMKHGKKRGPKEHEWMVKGRNLRKPIVRIEKGAGELTFTSFTLSVTEYIQAEYAFQRGRREFSHAEEGYENMENALSKLAKLFIDFPLKNIVAWNEDVDIDDYIPIEYVPGTSNGDLELALGDVPNGDLVATIFSILVLGFLKENVETFWDQEVAAGGRTRLSADEEIISEILLYTKIAANGFKGFTKGIQRAGKALFSINPPEVFESGIDAITESTKIIGSMIVVGAAVRAQDLMPNYEFDPPPAQDHIFRLFEDFIRAIKKLMTVLQESGYRGNAFMHFQLKCMEAGSAIGIAMDDYRMTGQ